MKTYKILIDLNSIKLNDNRGATETMVFRKTTAKFKCKHPIPYILFNNCTVTSALSKYPGEIICEGIITNHDIVERIINEKHSIDIEVEHHYDTFQHDPIPKYSYKYLSTKVECKRCKRTFYFEDLDSDYVYNELISEICPECGTAHCCDLEFEDISEAVKRQAL